MKYFNIPFSLIVIFYISCNSKQNSSSTDDSEDKKIIESVPKVDINGTWILSKVNDTTFNMSSYYGFTTDQPTMEIEKENNAINGFSGCNRYGGYAIITENQISFPHHIEATQIGCESDNTWELDFFNRLRSIKSYTLVENRLIITDSTNQKLEFIKQ